MNTEDIVYRLRKRAEIRRQIPTRKSVQEGKPDRLADLLDEAAGEIERLRNRTPDLTGAKIAEDLIDHIRELEARLKIDEGPWRAGVNKLDDRHFVESDDFKHDVRLYVDGDFGTDEEKRAYTEGLAQQLNASDVIELALCESRSLVLHIGKLYRFVPVPGCKKCEAMKKEHDEAYMSGASIEVER